MDEYEPCQLAPKTFNTSTPDGEPVNIANTVAVLRTKTFLPRIFASTSGGIENIQVIDPRVVEDEARFCGSSYVRDPQHGYLTCLARNNSSEPEPSPEPSVAPSPSPSAMPSPSPSPDLSGIYRYLPGSVGMSMTQKRQACRNIGAGWDLAVITVGEEVLAMREYLTRFARPVNGSSAYSLPIIANACNTISCMDFPTGYSPHVDCSGSKILLLWPGVWSNCEPASTKRGARSCLFADGEKESKFPILCEHNSGPYAGPPSCGGLLSF